MTVAMLMSVSASQAELNQELRTYARNINLRELSVPTQTLLPLLDGLSSSFDQSGLSSQEILESVGIASLIKISRGNVPTYFSCSITTSRGEAEEQLAYFQQETFINFRKELDIASHWIFLVNEDYLRLCSRDEFVDWLASYKELGKPDCWIIDEVS